MIAGLGPAERNKKMTVGEVWQKARILAERRIASYAEVTKKVESRRQQDKEAFAFDEWLTTNRAEAWSDLDLWRAACKWQREQGPNA